MNIQINNIHSTNSLSIIKALSRIEKYDIIVIGSDIYKKGECAGSLLVDKYYQAPPITQEAEYINFLNDVNEKENVDLLIPASDAEATICEGNCFSSSQSIFTACGNNVNNC